MSEMTTRINGIDKLVVKNSKREVKEEGDIVDTELVTQVSFEAINVDTKKLSSLISMIKGDVPVDVFFGSPQAILAFEDKPDKELARV